MLPELAPTAALRDQEGWKKEREEDMVQLKSGQRRSPAKRKGQEKDIPSRPKSVAGGAVRSGPPIWFRPQRGMVGEIGLLDGVWLPEMN